MSMVKNGFSSEQATTRPLLTLGLNITPEDYGFVKVQEET